MVPRKSYSRAWVILHSSYNFFNLYECYNSYTSEARQCKIFSGNQAFLMQKFNSKANDSALLYWNKDEIRGD